MNIRLTAAQVSTLECAGLDLPDLTANETTLANAWAGYTLVVTAETKEAIYQALNTASNSEDGCAEDTSVDPEIRRDCRRAAKTLSLLASKVIRCV